MSLCLRGPGPPFQSWGGEYMGASSAGPWAEGCPPPPLPPCWEAGVERSTQIPVETGGGVGRLVRCSVQSVRGLEGWEQALGTTPSVTLLAGVAPPSPALSSAPTRTANVPTQMSTASVPLGLLRVCICVTAASKLQEERWSRAGLSA